MSEGAAVQENQVTCVWCNEPLRFEVGVGGATRTERYIARESMLTEWSATTTVRCRVGARLEGPDQPNSERRHPEADKVDIRSSFLL
jgi:hypothetical protein